MSMLFKLSTFKGRNWFDLLQIRPVSCRARDDQRNPWAGAAASSAAGFKYWHCSGLFDIVISGGCVETRFSWADTVGKLIFIRGICRDFWSAADRTLFKFSLLKSLSYFCVDCLPSMVCSLVETYHLFCGCLFALMRAVDDLRANTEYTGKV